MFLGSPLPSFCEIFSTKEVNSKLYWENKPTLLMSESWGALQLLFNSYYQLFNKKNVIIYLPDYFCDSTVEAFRENWMTLCYYPVNKNFEPNWKFVEKMKENNDGLDFFIFVHYFGMEKNVGQALDFCRRSKTILIEDCAHVLLAKGRISTKGDFVIFSPHKQLPLPDGAVLMYNEKNETSELWEYVKQNYRLLTRKKDNKLWYVKKFIQKFVKVCRKVNYQRVVHVGSGDLNSQSIHQISKKSERILRKFYDYSVLKKICQIRRDNLDTYNYLIQKVNSDIIALNDSKTFSPYYAVYSLENVSNKEQISQILMSMGIMVLYWPDLPRDIENKKYSHEVSFKLSEDIIVIPIHQDISPHKIIKNNGRFLHAKEELSLFRIDWNKGSQVEWQNLLERIEDSNISQDWVYGEVKRDVEGWKLSRGIICTGENEKIGIVQILTKKIFGISVAVRVNRGPLFIKKYNTVDNQLQVMSKVKKEIAGIKPIFFAPCIRWTPENVSKLVDYNWKFKDCLGFSSGVIDLLQTEEDIRKSFDSKWRNQLLSSEKHSITIHNDSSRFEELVKVYHHDKIDRGYSGIPDEILLCLNKYKNVLEVYYALDTNGVLLGFDFFYKHGRTVTYLVGWNSSDGRKHYLNNLLLYHTIIEMKKKGMVIFDLGGIDDIHTESIAKFKRGVRPIEYRFIGEFVK